MPNEKPKSLDNINDILIIRKIEPPTETCEREFEESWDLDLSTFDGEEKNLLAEEHEAIVRKQLQMLQADERGKQALISEIAAIKEKQRKRAETLKNRQRALDIEKKRSKKVASLPPPLPKSVKSLLKKHDIGTLNTQNKPDVQMPDELKAIHIEPIQIDNEENKENVMDPREIAAREKMQEEWSLKARKRFNEALKKDRQKEEYANIMQQIQNAELQNRREMAKRISSDKVKNVPCPISDKFQSIKKQTDMEDAAEKLFKKKSTKEHVIEEIEGYQDHYEVKYGKISSEYEAKMIDCVPSFVKENYEYLLEEESRFEGGKNFSGLNESGSDVLNQAYIETSPTADEFDARQKIDTAIDQLDKLRSELQAEYDLTVKPLLVAAIENPKQDVIDKAVETDATKSYGEDKAVEADILKLPTEAKAVETDISQYISPLSALPDFSYKRKHQGPFLQSYQHFNIPDMHQRDVRYILPTTSSAESGTISWSTSSYCSLPSKHGALTLHSSSESVKCDICVAEIENVSEKDISLIKHPKSNSAVTEDRKLIKVYDTVPSSKTVSVAKNSLSKYVKLLAEKYIETKQTAVETVPKEVDINYSDSVFPDSSTATLPAFVKQKICKASIGSFPSDSQLSEKSPATPKELITDAPSPPMKHVFDEIQNNEKKSSYDGDESKIKHIESDYELQDNVLQKDHSEVKSSDYYASSTEYSEFDSEVKRLQLIQEMLSRRISHSNLHYTPERIHLDRDNAQLENEPSTSGYVIKKGAFVYPHIYHELSTIQEVDSALTAGSLQISKLSLSPEKSSVKPEEHIAPEKLEEKLEHSTENLKIVSLLDPPDSEIAELAKSIHFVADAHEKQSEPPKIQQIPSTKSLNVIQTSENVASPSLSMHSSESSSVSDTKVLSSTLAQKYEKNSFLKDPKILPLYFKDISDFQYVKISDSDSSVKTHSSPASTFSGPISPLSSSSQSFTSVVEMKEAKDDKFKIVTNHPLVSGYVNDKIMVHSSSSDNFRPMTPHSDFSSPYSHSNKYIMDLGDKKFSAKTKEASHDHPMKPRHSTENNDSSKSLNVYSNTSAKEYGLLTPRSEQEHNESFKAMTPHSNISFTKEFTQEHQDCIAEAESFKPLTPRSISPSVISEDIHLREKGTSIEHSKFCPMTLRFDILTSQSSSSGDANSTKSPIKKLPQIKCQVNMKAQTLKSVKYPQSPKIKEKKMVDISSNVRKKLVYIEDKSTKQVQIKKISGEMKAKQTAHLCSSDFFIPQSDVTHIPNLSKNTNEELKEGTMSKESIAIETELKSTSEIPAFHPTISSSNSSENSKYKDINYSSSEPTSSFEFEKPWKKYEKISLEKETADPNQKQHFLSTDVVKDAKMQHTNLQAVSSGSSSENLSDMFSGSRIVNQSTPIKSMEEIMQESGILEEPDLTLMATKLNCKPDSPELPRDLSCAGTTNSVADNLVKEKDCTIESSRDECRTPSLQSPQILGSADTPSMISFLHHEKNCIDEENLGTEINLGTDSNTPNSKVNLKENQKHHKFPRADYKQRTKRLWNNLEEIRKKNLAEERKKVLIANRLKAKEFAKKLTPKRK